MVEQVHPRRHKVFVAVEVFVLAHQQVDGFRTDELCAGANGHAVVDVGRGIGVALRCCGQAIGLGDRVGLQVDVRQRIDVRFTIAVDLGVVAHLGVGVGRRLDFGFHQSNRYRPGHIHLPTRRATHFVVGPHFQQTLQRDVGAVAQTGECIAIHAGVDVGACATDHTATAALGIERLQVGTGQVVGGQHAQTVGHQLGAVEHTGRGRAVHGGMGDSARCTQGRCCGRGAVHVVAHLAGGTDVGIAAHRQRVVTARAQIGRDRQVMVNPRFGTGPCDHAARARNGFAVDAFIAGGRDLQNPAHQTFELVGLRRHRGVAAGLGGGHANAHKSGPNAGGIGIGFHRVDGADTHIPCGGQQRLTGQNDFGRALVF